MLDSQFIIKGYNSGAGRGKRCLGQGVGKELELPRSPGAPFSPNLHVFTILEALQTPSSWGFMEASLHRHD